MQKQKQKSELTKALEQKNKEEDKAGNFKVSFQDFDSSQAYGSSYNDWQQVGLLSSALKVLQGYCCSSLVAQVDKDKFIIYGDFPPSNITKFDHPKHVTPDAEWARIHVNGPACLIGHVFKGTFYLVFLDKTHKFWPTKHKRKKKDGGLN